MQAVSAAEGRLMGRFAEDTDGQTVGEQLAAVEAAS